MRRSSASRSAAGSSTSCSLPRPSPRRCPRRMPRPITRSIGQSSRSRSGSRPRISWCACRPPVAARPRTSPRPRSRRRYDGSRPARTSASWPRSCRKTPPPRPRAAISASLARARWCRSSRKRDPQVGETVFGLAIGGVAPVIRTPGGFVIARVVESLPAGVPPFAEIKDKAVIAVKRERASVLAEERAKAFAASVKTGDFLAAARRDKLAAGETPFFSRGEPPQGKDAPPNPVLLAALRTPAGEISEPVRAPGGFYVVKTVERRVADPQGVDKVRGELGRQLLESKRNPAWERWIKALFAGAKI